MAVQNIEVTTESILGAVVRMPEREFNEFIKKAKQLPTERRNGKIKLIQKLEQS